MISFFYSKREIKYTRFFDGKWLSARVRPPQLLSHLRSERRRDCRKEIKGRETLQRQRDVELSASHLSNETSQCDAASLHRYSVRIGRAVPLRTSTDSIKNRQKKYKENILRNAYVPIHFIPLQNCLEHLQHREVVIKSLIVHFVFLPPISPTIKLLIVS